MTLDITDRESRHSLADSLRPALANQGVVAVATTFVDNAGITRVKTVPLDRLPQLAAWGAGFSPSFDYFRFDDWMAAPPGGWAPVGDLRLMPDLQRVVPLGAQPGWAWAPTRFSCCSPWLPRWRCGWARSPTACCSAAAA